VKAVEPTVPDDHELNELEWNVIVDDGIVSPEEVPDQQQMQQMLMVVMMKVIIWKIMI
jgi:hypothetical protein